MLTSSPGMAVSVAKKIPIARTVLFSKFLGKFREWREEKVQCSVNGKLLGQCLQQP